MTRFLILSLIAGLAGGMVANKKGRDWALWAALCAFFPFLLVVILMLSPALAGSLTKKCPYCAEIIKHEATVCKHCGREVPIEMVQCRDCGTVVPAGDYCLRCNRRLR